MIGEFLRKGLAWARTFFWVSDSDDEAGRRAAPSSPAKPKPASQKVSAPKSTAQRRPAEAKTSTNKRATGSAKRPSAKAGGAQSTATKGTGTKSATKAAPKSKAAPKTAAPKSTGPKSTGPGAPEADPAKPGDLTEIKGVGPALKTKLAQLGIKSFADLAGANADQVAKSLNQRTITPERVRAWIAEAKKRS